MTVFSKEVISSSFASSILISGTFNVCSSILPVLLLPVILVSPLKGLVTLLALDEDRDRPYHVLPPLSGSTDGDKVSAAAPCKRFLLNIWDRSDNPLFRLRCCRVGGTSNRRPAVIPTVLVPVVAVAVASESLLLASFSSCIGKSIANQIKLRGQFCLLVDAVKSSRSIKNLSLFGPRLNLCLVWEQGITLNEPKKFVWCLCI